MAQKTGSLFRVGGLLQALICAGISVGCAGGPSDTHAGSTISPSIVAEPTNQTVTTGQSAIFSVVASGTPPPSYQWQKDSADIPGANASSYTTPATTTADNGSTFDVIVSNPVGSVTSSSAKLSVNPVPTAPSITAQPANQTVTAGQSASFSVVATGTAPLSYQWQENGANISGANAANYVTPPTINTDNGSTFDVIVSNSAGSVTSNTATLTVNPTTSNINFGSGFTSSGLTLNGSAAVSGTRLRLTDGGTAEAGSAFFSTLVNVQSFITVFDFQLTAATADGFTFTIQNNSATALGGGGESLGYGPTSGAIGGIPNSVAPGFQLYTGASGEVNLVGLWTNGASPAATPGTDMSGASINLHSGDIFKVRLGYSGTTLVMDIRDITKNDTHFTKSFTINIPATVGSDTAYVGFTGGDGGLTAIQDILSWSYSSSSTGTSGTFIWPVDAPAFIGVNDYSTYNGQYHTGLDLCPGTSGCQSGDPIYATASGTIQAVQVTTDPNQTMCDGSSTGSLTTESNNHLGNAVIIAHPNGKFSVYGHMDCVWPGIAPGVSVSQGQRIGNIGNSQYGVRDNTFTPHVHFEIKDAGVFEDPTGLGYSGFTPDLPDGYGYHDPRLYLFPFSQSSVSATAVKVAASPSLPVLTGPDTSYSFLTSITTGQEFVAFASSGSWYEIYLPNSEGPVSGWIPASAGSVTLAAPDSTATRIQVTNTGGSGLPIRPSASSATNFVSWVNNAGFLPAVQNCDSSAKIWDGQFYVTSANQSGWYQFYLPANYYFSSANTCKFPSGFGPSFGWASGSFLNVIP